MNDIIQCLKKKPSMTLVDPPTVEVSDYLQFIPTIDGQYISEPIEVSLESGNYGRNVDIMIGTTHTEGHGISQVMLLEPMSYGSKVLNMTDLETIIGITLGIFYPDINRDNYPHLIPEISKTYHTGQDNSAIRRDLAEFFGDVLMTYPTYETARQLSGNTLL